MQQWFYDERKHAGVDYADPAQVQAYDARHQRLRDYGQFAAGIVRALGLCREHTVIDMGSGTGAFALNAAPACKHIYAVDVSEVMLDCARRKAAQAGVKNIDFCAGGFLTYAHQADAADAMVSVAALHHLPDFWKLVGLRRAAAMLKPGGRFYLSDVVFPADLTGYEARFDQWIEGIAQKAGHAFAAEAATHIRDEYSTFDWIMEGFLRKSGFRIDQAEYAEGFLASFVCTKL